MMARPKRQIVWTAALLGLATLATTPAAAQTTSQSKFELSANVGAQTGAGTFTLSEEFPSNGAEKETLTVDHGSKTGVGFSGGGAVRIVPKFWVGVQVAVVQTKADADIAAAVPHPILFNTPRNVQGTINDVAHNEQNVHVDLMYALPVQAMEVRVMGGPTFFNLEQDFVSDLTINETYPFDTATFKSASTKRLSKGAVGFNVGVDISRPISPALAIGGLVRYSRADVKFDDPEIGKQTVTAGGVEAAAGIRIRF